MIVLKWVDVMSGQDDESGGLSLLCHWSFYDFLLSQSMPDAVTDFCSLGSKEN